MEEGFCPNIKSMCENFVYGPLETVFPPVTAPAWLSMATGLNPGKTGVFDYINRVSPDGNLIAPISSAAYQNRAVWDYLNRNNVTVGIFNYPTLYPPPQIKGFAVSGMGAKNLNSFCYPEQLNSEISSITDSYKTSLNLRNRKYKQDINLFFKDIDKFIANQKKVLLHLMQNKEWDFFFAVFSFTDWMQHVLWKDIDQGHPFYNSKTSPAVHHSYKKMWKKIDAVIGDILDLLPVGSNFIIVSDHGSGPLDSVFYSNTWLQNKGWLKKKKTTVLKSIIADSFSILSESYDNKYSTKLSNFIKRKILNINSTMDFIDIKTSLAYSPEHNTMFGCINLTAKGKSQDGFKENLIKELYRLPESYNAINSVTVILPEDVYSGPFVHLSPDIFFIVNDYCSTVEIAFSKEVFIQSPSIELRTGGHRRHGVFIARGDIFKRGTITASILDIAPTILALYDIEIPDTMDGKMLSQSIKHEILEKMNIRVGKGFQNTSQKESDKKDLDDMKDLLKSLGYM
jgi:predicted AlkP superfamily phosphohydrolase/phosphomutase